MSAVDTAVTALVAVFGTATPTAQIIDGPIQGVAIIEREVVVVGGEDIIGTSEFDSMSATTTTEEFDVPIIASVSIPGNSMSAARNAAIQFYETLKAAVIADPTLGTGLGASFQAWPTGDWSVQPRADENGRHAAYRWSVHVMATNT